MPEGPETALIPSQPPPLELAGLAWTGVVQQHVPATMVGRVSSIDSVGSFALLPINYALTGWSTDRFGASAVFLAGAASMAVVARLSLTHPAVRALD